MKVYDIRSDRFLFDQTAAMMANLGHLAERRDSFVECRCPACGVTSCETLYEKCGMTHASLRALRNAVNIAMPLTRAARRVL